MTAFSIDSLGTYGGALNDYSPVEDPTTDLPAAAGNRGFSAVAGMTHVSPRAWVSMTVNGTATPTLVAVDSMWAVTTPTAPVLAYSGTAGIYTITWPASVQDEITNSSSPGYTGPLALNLRAGWCNLRVANGGAAFFAFVTVTSGNTANIIFFNSSGAQANPGTVTVDVFFI